MHTAACSNQQPMQQSNPSLPRQAFDKRKEIPVLGGVLECWCRRSAQQHISAAGDADASLPGPHLQDALNRARRRLRKVHLGAKPISDVADHLRRRARGGWVTNAAALHGYWHRPWQMLTCRCRYLPRNSNRLPEVCMLCDPDQQA